MRKYFVGSSILVFGFLMLVVMGLTGSQAKLPQPAVKVLSIPAPAFEMPDESTGYVNYGRLYLTKAAAYIRAPLVLPNGTKITKVELVCKDASASASMRLWVHVVSNDGSTSVPICLAESTGTGTGYRTFSTTTINPNVIDNAKNFYMLNVRIPTKGQATFELCGAKIYYTGTW